MSEPGSATPSSKRYAAPPPGESLSLADDLAEWEPRSLPSIRLSVGPGSRRSIRAVSRISIRTSMMPFSRSISYSKRPSRYPFTSEARADVEDLLRHPVFLETCFEIHHSIRKCDHLLRSARFARTIAGFLRANRRTCARAGLLHDLHSRLGTWSTHGGIAASVATEMGESNDVCDAIVPHMFPLGPAPKTREGWVLVLADKLATLADTLYFVLHAVFGSGLKQRKMLRARDRYYKAKETRRETSTK